MPIVANELHDTPAGKAWSIKRTRAGFEGTKWYWVNSDLSSAAILAENLPKIGDPWSQDEELRLCVATEIGPTERMGGKDRGNGTGGGLSHVPVRYQSISSVGGGGGNEPPKAQGHLDRWCTIKTSLEMQPVGYPVDEDNEPQRSDPPLMNGEGTTRPAVVTDYEVSVAYDESRSVPDIDRFDRLGDPCHTNRNAITLPPILRSRIRRTKAAGECLYRGYELSQDGEFLVVTHTISVRSGGPYSWYFRFENLDEQGQFVSPGEVRILPSSDWSGLFN